MNKGLPIRSMVRTFRPSCFHRPPFGPWFLSCLVMLGFQAIFFVAASAENTDLEALLTAGRWSDAETAARAMVNRRPSSAPGWYYLGRARFERGRSADLDDAVLDLSRAVSLDADLASAWFWLGRASGQAAGRGGLLDRIRLAGRARDAFAEALELEPDNIEFAYALVQFDLRAPAMVGGGVERAQGVVRGFVGRHVEERMLLEASISLAGTDYQRARRQLSRVNDMEDHLIRRIWKEIALQLGREQLSVRAWGGAVETHRMITEKFPDNSAGFLGLGRALEGKGNSVDARAAYRRCVELAPESPAAEAAKLRLGATVDG